MGLSRILMTFALLLLVATATAFLGYRYIGLASEYRSRNFIHISEVELALKTAQGSAVIHTEDAAKLERGILRAREQAVWCIDNLSALETFLFKKLGAAEALDICAKDNVTSARALALLAEIDQPETLLKQESQSAFALRLRLLAVLGKMHDHSLQFHPYTELIQSKISRIVTVGTTLTSVSLVLVFAFLSRLLLQAWGRLNDQKRDVERMSQRFSLAMQASGEGIALFDANRSMIACNDRYRALAQSERDPIPMGMTPEQVMRRALAKHVYRLSPRNSRNRDRMVRDHFQKLEQSPEGVQLELMNDRHVVEKMAFTSFGDILITRSDISEFIRSERDQAAHASKLEAFTEEIKHRSLTDALTGLPNRRKLDQVLQSADPIKAAPLIRIDLDRFKQVNDMLGHEAGDFVLQTVADILRRHTRPGDLPARIGGDEFVVVCAPGTSLTEAEAVSARLLADILEPVRFGNKRCVYGASFGIAEPRAGDNDGSGVLRDADFALYRAKSEGRGRIETFTENMRRAAKRDRTLADDFVEALGNGEIVPFFQTQHDAQTRALTGVEVLARWQHPREGILSPDAFLPIAYQLGMDADLDEVIFRSAIDVLRGFDAIGLHVPSAAFNVSAGRIADPSFIKQVRALTDIDPSRVVFEILETVSLESMGSVLHFAIDALKEAGFKIEVDDFGSGHASINALLDIQPHALKIDRNLIKPLGENDRAERTVGAIIDMARSANVQVVAEGVDTEEKARILTEKSCDRLQGYLFSKPMSQEHLHSYIVDCKSPLASSRPA